MCSMTSGLYESKKTKFLLHENGRIVVCLPRKILESFDNTKIVSWSEKDIDLFLLESVLCKWSLIALCRVRIVSTLQLSFMLFHFIAQYGQPQIRKSFKLFLWVVCVRRSLWLTWLTLQNTVPCLHGSRVTYIKWFIVHCALQWSLSKKVSRPNWLYIFSVF